jgi:hypothetical protein
MTILRTYKNIVLPLSLTFATACAPHRVQMTRPAIPDISADDPCTQRFFLQGDRTLTAGEIKLAKEVAGDDFRPEFVTINALPQKARNGALSAVFAVQRICFFGAENAAPDYSLADPALRDAFTRRVAEIMRMGNTRRAGP